MFQDGQNDHHWDNLQIWMEKIIFFHHKHTKWFIASRRYSWNCSYFIIFCDIIKCTVLLINMKFGRYLKMVNYKSIMFKKLITVEIRKFCIVGNLSDKILSTSPARFRCIMWQDIKIWSQLNIINILLDIVCLTMSHHLFLEFWLVDTWLTMRHHLFLKFWLIDLFFSQWHHHHAVTWLENVCQI